MLQPSKARSGFGNGDRTSQLTQQRLERRQHFLRPGAAGIRPDGGIIVLFDLLRVFLRHRDIFHEGQAPGPTVLVFLVLGGVDLRQEHLVIRRHGRHHLAQDPLLLQRDHALQHPGRPAGRVLRVRLHHGQRHLVRQIPRPVDDVHALGIFIVQVQGQVMLDTRHAREMVRVRFPADLAGHVGRRRLTRTATSVSSCV